MKGTSNNNPYAIAATSGSNAWIVGNYYDGTNSQSLVLHWNGTWWRIQASPNFGTLGDGLTGVAATTN